MPDQIRKTNKLEQSTNSFLFHNQGEPQQNSVIFISIHNINKIASENLELHDEINAIKIDLMNIIDNYNIRQAFMETKDQKNSLRNN